LHTDTPYQVLALGMTQYPQMAIRITKYFQMAISNDLGWC